MQLDPQSRIVSKDTPFSVEVFKQLIVEGRAKKLCSLDGLAKADKSIVENNQSDQKFYFDLLKSAYLRHKDVADNFLKQEDKILGNFKTKVKEIHKESSRNLRQSQEQATERQEHESLNTLLNQL